jgi:hypothetical protein
LIRFLSLLTIACWLGALVLLSSDSADSATAAVILIFLGAGIAFFLAVRSAILRVRDFAADAKGFLSGDIQEARLVSVADPKGWFNPSSAVTIEFQGADGKAHSWDRDVPVPFPVAWSYRLGKRFNVPGMKQLDMSEMLATQLRRQGLKLTVSRPAPQAP